jgi:uncharacterized membrane-anchored protein
MATKLTKRNEEFIFQLNKLLKNDDSFDSDKSKEIVSQVTKELSEGQKSGKTARQLFGTASEYLGDLKDPKAAQARKDKLKSASSNSNTKNDSLGDAKGPGIFDFSFLSEMVDTALTIFILFSVLFALSGAFAGSASTNNQLGIVSTVLISLFAGSLYVYGMRLVTYDPKHSEDRPSIGLRLGVILAMIILWVGGFLVISLIPKVVNPSIPWFIYIALAGGAYLLIRYWRTRTSLPNSIFSVSVLFRNSNLRARMKLSQNSRGKK